MDTTEKKRKLLLGGALIVTLIAVVLVEEEDEERTIDTVESVHPARSSNDRVKAQENNSEFLDVSKLGQRKFNASAGELFMSTTWMPKQAPISLEEQAAKAQQIAKASAASISTPKAPPLPFKYTGKAITDNEKWVFLSQSGENHIAKVGTRIINQYRLDSISEDIITLTYLPLNIKQTLQINNKIAGNL